MSVQLEPRPPSLTVIRSGPRSRTSQPRSGSDGGGVTFGPRLAGPRIRTTSRHSPALIWSARVRHDRSESSRATRSSPTAYTELSV